MASPEETMFRYNEPENIRVPKLQMLLDQLIAAREITLDEVVQAVSNLVFPATPGHVIAVAPDGQSFSFSPPLTPQWGDIGGDIANQNDLEAALAVKYDASNPAGYITAITGGMVDTALGYTPASAASFTGTSSGTNTGDQVLPTRASLGLATTDTVVFANLSGSNTGDQFTALTSSRILGRASAGFGAAEELTSGQVRTILSLATTDAVTFGNITGGTGTFGGPLTVNAATTSLIVGGLTVKTASANAAFTMTSTISTVTVSAINPAGTGYGFLAFNAGGTISFSVAAIDTFAPNTLALRLTPSAVNGLLPIQRNGVQVVNTRKTGWAVATGTASRTTFDTTTVTLPLLAERVKALIDDLHGTAGHGLIGT